MEFFMKTLIKIFAALAVLASFAACRGEEGPMGPMGPRGPKGEDGAGTNWEVIEYEIPADEWVYNQEMGDLDHGYWAYVGACPEITEEIYKIGIVTATVMAPDFQAPLPYTRFYYNENKELWTQNIDFEYAPGVVKFFVTNNDFFVEDPLDYKFRVAMIW